MESGRCAQVRDLPPVGRLGPKGHSPDGGLGLRSARSEKGSTVRTTVKCWSEEQAMGEGIRGNGKTLGARTLEPIARDNRFGQPSCYRVGRLAEPAPKHPSRLLILPPVWARASF